MWSNLEEYKCPICGSNMKEDRDKHECSSCTFTISDQKLSNMVVLRHKPLDPPDFIKEMRDQNKTTFISKLWKNLWKT